MACKAVLACNLLIPGLHLQSPRCVIMFSTYSKPQQSCWRKTAKWLQIPKWMLPDGLLPDLDFPFTTEQLESILSTVQVSFPFV
jgi:hypothetical protein